MPDSRAYIIILKRLHLYALALLTYYQRGFPVDKDKNLVRKVVPFQVHKVLFIEARSPVEACECPFAVIGKTLVAFPGVFKYV